MPKPLVVLNVVGLTHEMLGPDTPHISAVARRGRGDGEFPQGDRDGPRQG